MREQINLLEIAGFGRPASLPPRLFWMTLVSLVLALWVGALAYKKGGETSSLRGEMEGLRERKSAMLQEETRHKPEKGTVESIAPSRRVHWSAFLRELSLIIPEGVWMYRWDGAASEGNDVEVKMSGSAADYDRLALFLSALEHDHRVLEANLIDARRTDAEVRFEVEVKLKTEAGG
jgi:Tfp pilus assembly protein PilN